MPTKLRRENIFVERFLSAYEDFSWSKAAIRWLVMPLPKPMMSTLLGAEWKVGPRVS
jgi:hypothetical protein